MSDLISYVILGLSRGLIIGLLALGLVLIYKGTRILNLAQPFFGLLAAFLCWWFTAKATFLPFEAMSRPRFAVAAVLSLGLAPLVIERLMDTVQRLCDEEGLTVVIVEQQASFALGYTDRAYFMEKGEVRYEGPSAGLTERGDLLRSVYLAGASAGFARQGAEG